LNFGYIKITVGFSIIIIKRLGDSNFDKVCSICWLMKVLCICTMGLNRSKFLAEYLASLGHETRYGGVGPCKFDPAPANPAKKEDMNWADIIVTAKPKHAPILRDDFGIVDKKIISLDVTDSRSAMSKIYPEFKEISREDFNAK
jgi:predicted protein tyrosine phosphatase